MASTSRWQPFVEAAVRAAGTDHTQNAGTAPEMEPSPAAPPRQHWLRRVRQHAAQRRETSRNSSRSNVPPARTWDLRLLPAALTGWAAAAVTVRLPPSSGYAIGAVALLLAVVILLSCRKWSWPLVLLPLSVPLLAIAMMSLSAAEQLAERKAGPVNTAIAEEATVGAKVRITSSPVVSDTRDRYTGAARYLVEATLRQATDDGRKFTAATPILVIADDRWAQLEAGQLIETAGSLSRAGAGDDIDALFFAKTAPEVVEPAPSWLQYTGSMRAKFGQRAQNLSPDAAQLLPGMVLGDRSQLGTDLETAMQRTGLTHLTAVSGANCAIVVGTVFLCCCAIRLPRWACAAVALVALAGFVLLVRPEPSVLRAAVMGTIGVAAMISGRGRKSPTLLCLAVIVLLGIDPWLSGSYAFILSVLATSGLIIFGAACARWLGRWLPMWVAQAVAVPIAAQAFCAPVIVLLQPHLMTYSVVANVLVAPLIPLITIAGMCCVLAMLLCPPLATVLMAVAGAGAYWVGAVARFFSAAPAAAIAWPEGAAGAALMAVLSLACMGVLWLLSDTDRLSTCARNAYHCASELPRPVAGLAVGAALGSATAGIAFTTLPAGQQGDWSVVACDVGQGDGLLVRTGKHSAMVVDTGPEPAPMERCLDDLSISTVSLLVLTHMHSDHTGGVAGVLSGREVEQALISVSGDGGDAVVDTLARQGVDMTKAGRGAGGVSGTASWTTLWPATEQDTSSENNSSIVMWVRVEQPGGEPLSLLLTGDLEEDGVRRLLADFHQQPVAAGLIHGNVDVLKVAHHGAANGGTELITGLRPDLALISVGADNDYGHPSKEILTALQQAGSQIRRTDQDGRVYVGKRSGTLLTWSER
ncbi:ComEC/Rec2 family competence protein [Arthrobacter pigmenti]